MPCMPHFCYGQILQVCSLPRLGRSPLNTHRHTHTYNNTHTHMTGPYAAATHVRVAGDIVGVHCLCSLPLVSHVQLEDGMGAACPGHSAAVPPALVSVRKHEALLWRAFQDQQRQGRRSHRPQQQQQQQQQKQESTSMCSTGSSSSSGSQSGALAPLTLSPPLTPVPHTMLEPPPSASHLLLPSPLSLQDPPLLAQNLQENIPSTVSSSQSQPSMLTCSTAASPPREPLASSISSFSIPPACKKPMLLYRSHAATQHVIYSIKVCTPGQSDKSACCRSCLFLGIQAY